MGMVNNILDKGAYLASHTPVSVGSTVALSCGLGYVPDVNASTFNCVYSTPYNGVFGTPYPTCDPVITTTSTAAPATTAAATPKPGAATTAAPITRTENVTTYTIKSALTLAFGSLPANVTAVSLAADVVFINNVAYSISTGLKVDVSKVTITGIVVLNLRRLSAAAQRQL